jgi:hypothetical protein
MKGKPDYFFGHEKSAIFFFNCIKIHVKATNFSNSYSNDMLTVKLSGFPDMHWWDLFTSTRYELERLVAVYSVDRR